VIPCKKALLSFQHVSIGLNRNRDRSAPEREIVALSGDYDFQFLIEEHRAQVRSSPSYRSDEVMTDSEKKLLVALVLMVNQ